MRVAVSGSHGTGKTTLIAAFLAQCPWYRHEPEAFEVLGDDVDMTPEGPTAEGLGRLLEHTIASLASYATGSCAVFERSPADYLAYAVASRSWPRGERARLLRRFVPRVRESLRGLDLVVLLPVSSEGPDARPGESPRFRRVVDEALRRTLLDDDFELLDDGRPRVVALPAAPERRLRELLRLTTDQEEGGTR